METVTHPAGDRAVLIDVATSDEALALAAAVRVQLGPLVDDVVPGHRTVLVTWARQSPRPAVDWPALACAAVAQATHSQELVTIPVRYGGPDLTQVARLAGISGAELVARHSAPTYRTAFVGFAPGFAYLLGGDPRLEVPRRPDPRPKVPAGSVAIAGPYTAVYPQASPGGWQLIGSTDAVLFDPDRQPPALLSPGTQVRFEPR